MCEHYRVTGRCNECRQDQDTKMAVSTLVSLGGGQGGGGQGGGDGEGVGGVYEESLGGKWGKGQVQVRQPAPQMLLSGLLLPPPMPSSVPWQIVLPQGCPALL